MAHSTEKFRNTFHITQKTPGNVFWANSPLVRIESFRVLDNFPIGILSSIGRCRQLLEYDTQQLMFGKCCCIRITLRTILTHQIIIQVLCNHFCRCLPFVYDHTMWTVVVRCQVDTVSVTGVKTVAMLWTEFPDTNMVNFHIEYVYNFKTCVESLILYKVNAHCNSLK